VDFNLKSLKVSGKMSTKDADIVARRLSLAALIFASCTGRAALLAAIRWW